ncbi:MAG: LysR family transcriptional regulator [Candidatus Dormibacteraeota bacterium]|nr:LysR family transcriptional regulator [Candidatus Dormibacteraeota bacterium]MBO0760552.1 LysR family transcriptional regulator [Candidatus Dormibacteraeota bacterium]
MPAVNLRKFDLNLLVALDALLHHRNVTRAGEQIGLSQSAMSGELRRLRRMFGDELLVRVGRDYELTALARDLIDPVRDVVERIERAIGHRTTFDPAVEARRFSVVMSDYAMLLLLQPLLRRSGVEAPGITIEVHPFNEPIPRMLGQHDVDLAVGPEMDLAGLRAQSLFIDRFVCVVSADHPDVGDRMTPQLFESLPHLTIAWQSRLRSIADEHLDVAGVRRRVEVTTENFALAPFLIAGTRLVALVPERLAYQLRAAAGVNVLDPPVPLPELRETLYWSPVSEGDPGHAWLRRMIAGVACAIA